MRLIHLTLWLILPISANAENKVEQNIYKVRSSYLAAHISTFGIKPTEWKVGELDVPAATYKQKNEELVIGYSIKSDDKTYTGEIKINQNRVSSNPSDWMRNPTYTSSFHGLVAVAISNDMAKIETVNVLPDNTISNEDLSKIQKFPNGYQAINDNLNASVSEKYGEAMVGWCGISRENSLSGEVIFSLLRQTKKSFRSSAVAVLVSGKSKINHENLRLLTSLAFADVNDADLAEAIATGIMATIYCSPWQNDRLCDEAKNYVVQELKTSKYNGQVLDFIKLENRIDK